MEAMIIIFVMTNAGYKILKKLQPEKKRRPFLKENACLMLINYVYSTTSEWFIKIT